MTTRFDLALHPGDINVMNNLMMESMFGSDEKPQSSSVLGLLGDDDIIETFEDEADEESEDELIIDMGV